MGENELRNCPFCGGNARIIIHHNEELTWIRYSVKCYRCCAESNKYRVFSDAEAAWNRRVGEEETT